MKAVPASMKHTKDAGAAARAEGKAAVTGPQSAAPGQAYLMNLAAKVNSSPHVAAQFRLSGQFQQDNRATAQAAFSGAVSETPDTAGPVAQRVLDIQSGKDSGTFDQAGDLPKNLTFPKRLNGVRHQILKVLGDWADLKGETKTFKNWAVAIEVAAKEGEKPVAKSSVEEHKVKREEQKKERVGEEESSSGREGYVSDEGYDSEEDEVISLNLPESTQDLSRTRALYFTDEGDFATEEGEALSRSKALQLANSLALSHIYQGHGPDIGDHTLRSMALTSGVSGKWSTDFDAIMAVVLAYREIALGRIEPSADFKIFNIGPLANSVNYRRRGKEGEYVLFPAPATKAKVGFKKQSLGKGKGHYYSLKTVFPYPQKVDDDGNLLGY